MGLLDLLNSDQGLLGMSLLAASAPQERRQSFGGGLLQALQNVQASRNAREDRDMRKQQFDLQQQQAQQGLTQGNLAIQQLQRQMEDQAAQRAFRNAIPGPQAQPLPAGPYIGPAQDSQAANVPQPMGVDPNAALLHKAMQSGLVSPMDYLNSLRKDNTPFVLKEGETAFGRGANGLPDFTKPLAKSAKNENPADWKLYLLSGAPQRGMSFDEWDLRRRQAGAANVSMGSPVPVVLGNGETALVQPSNRPGAPPQIMRLPDGAALKPPPSDKVKDAMRENAAALNKIDRAIAEIDKYPAALGGQNYFDVGGAVMQRMDPKGIDVRALVADIGSQKIHDRSGAAVTASETPRLRPFIPAATDTSTAAKRKLELYRRELQFMQQELNSGATLQQVSVPRAGGLNLPSQDAIAAELARRQQGGN